MTSEAEQEFAKLQTRLTELKAQKRPSADEQRELRDLEATLEIVPNAEAYKRQLDRSAQVRADVASGNVVDTQTLLAELKRQGIINE